MSVISPFRPRLLTPGLSALAAGEERHVIRGGGSMGFAVEPGDRLDLTLFEGGQTVEIVAFDGHGRDGLAALGLTAAGEPDGLRRILAADTEDAARVRAGLDRRRLELRRVRAARLFSPDAPAGEEAALTVTAPLFVIIAAPAEPMTVWEQTPPTDVLVMLTRSGIEQPSRPRLPEPLAEPRLDLRIPIASAIEFEVFKGEYIQIIDVEGRQCSDFLAFDRRALDKGRLLGIDSTTTRTQNGSAYPVPGLFSKFFDRDRNALVEVVQDTVGRHDTFNLACTASYYESMGYFGHANCSDNFNATLAPVGIESWKGWPAINFFFNTNVNHLNQIWADEPWSRAGDYVLMRALTDLVCATSACPDDIDPANGWHLTEIHVRVYPATSLFKRSIGTRMSPDSPVIPTRESGFHPRTSALTRDFAEYRGFWVPTAYHDGGAIAEYWACREKAAIMDLSALRKLEVLGPDAETLLQRVMTRDVRKLGVGQVVYLAMVYEHGGMIDDGTLFRLGPDNFRWVGGSDDGLLWIKEQAREAGLRVLLKTATDQIHNVAVQGPASRDILGPLVWTPDGRPSIAELGWFRFTVGRIGGPQGLPVMVSRTGYTGELGYEVFCHPNDAPAVWDAIMAAGAPHGLTPFGFAALDLVRIEAGLVFAGHEFDSSTDPFEAGIGFAVPARKEEDFIGKAALESRRAHPQRRLVGLRIDSNEPVGHGDPVFVGRAEVGVVTSGMRSPLLATTIALARVDQRHAALGGVVEIGKLDGRQKRFRADIVPFPFYDPDKLRVRA